jgi:alkanesulfonate monooxygenase SsuD/methylene tetrahydromethanopterin reductase-like flavin-dependent oxidoreductase (luciferase family)
MKLATFIYSFGYNPASWRHPDSPVTASNNFAHMLNVAKLSEQGKFDFIFLADSAAAGVGAPAALSRLPNKMNRFEPLTLLSALAVSTDRIGLAATVSTSYSEPYNVARMFASLDHLSGGRACWNVVTSDHAETAFNYNLDGLPPHAARYERAREFVEVAFGLWDGWERDTLLLDREAPRAEPPGQAFPGPRSAQHRPLPPGPPGHCAGGGLTCRHRTRGADG